MKSVKRILSVLLAVVFALSMFGVCAFAEDNAFAAESDEPFKVVLETDKDSYEPGDTVSVTATVNTNYNCTTFILPIMYDASVYAAQSILDVETYNTVKNNGAIKSNADGYNFVAEIAESGDYAQTTWGCVVVQWTASVATGEVKVLNTGGEDEIAFSFNLKVKDDAERGKTGTILIPPEYGHFYNQAITDPQDGTTICYLDNLVMDFTEANAAVVAEEIDLVPASDSSTAVIDTARGYLYGLKTGMTTRDEFAPFIKVNRDAAIYSYSVEFTEYGVGTGAKIHVKSGENIVKTYSAVIFGDYNGDCDVNVVDLSIVARISALTFDAESPAQKFALDLNMDGGVDVFDLSIIARSSAGTLDINQVDPRLTSQ